MTFASFNSNVAQAQIVAENEAPFTAHVKLDYQIGLAAYLTAMDQKLEFTLNKPEEIIVNFKNTNRKSVLNVTLVSYDKDNNTLNAEITREDYRDNRSLTGMVNKTTFKHVLGNGTSVVRIKGQDPLSSGPFRFRFDF